MSDREAFFALAGIAATMLGTFIVAAVFYIGSDAHRRLGAAEAADGYWRSGMRWIFAAYAIPMLAGLALGALPRVWAVLIFIGLTAVLVTLTFDTGRRILRREGGPSSSTLKLNEWLTTIIVLMSAILPWVLGGWMPQPTSFIPSLFLILAAGFTSTAALLMTEFDASRGEVDPGASASQDDEI
ncbi:hypothetical protein QSU92_05510 [Microbacterium sp. ET2]|uniref:hypothetical protein n=1 Tax=Microbacterium albipurpureum TaxID=3050384 RepID=UPI00259C9306|nr:hypothetical protein [Microbacterium sp. ET2 (Ac-2212)]WJL96634.1 hypothetical protein QSU92_05510 [Microbacterium sp. ET2 (Ac-2212)]